MAAYERSSRSPKANRADGSFNSREIEEDKAPLGDLLRRFGQDAAALLRHEIALAKVELRENVKLQ
jgi:hypothetical protein